MTRTHCIAVFCVLLGCGAGEPGRDGIADFDMADTHPLAGDGDETDEEPAHVGDLDPNADSDFPADEDEGSSDIDLGADDDGDAERVADVDIVDGDADGGSGTDSDADAGSDTDNDSNGDADGEQESDTDIVVEPPFGPAWLVGGTRCSAPAPLVLQSSVTTVASAVAAGVALPDTSSCEYVDNDHASYFAFSVLEPSLVLVGVESEAPVELALYEGPCAASALAGSCGQSLSAELAVGTYVLAVGGPVDTSLVLSLARHALPPPEEEEEEEETWPPPLVGTDECGVSAPLLDMTQGPQFVSGSLSHATASGFTTVCDQAGETDVFYRVLIPSEGILSVAVAGPQDLQVATYADGCPALGPEAGCGYSSSTFIDPGVAYVRVMGDVDASYQLVASFTPSPLTPPPPPPGNCAAPVAVNLPLGTSHFSPPLDESLPNVRTVGCMSTESEKVYAITIDQPSLLTIDANYNRVDLTMGDCGSAASTVACTPYYDTSVLEVGAGTYYLFVERYSASSDVSITREPLPPRPVNDRCVNALPISFEESDWVYIDYDFTNVSIESTSTCGGARHLYYRLVLDSPLAGLRLPHNNIELLGSDCMTPLVCSSNQSCRAALAAGTYYVRLSSDSIASGTVSLQAHPVPAPVSNDTCGNATPFSLASGSVVLTVKVAGAADNAMLLGASCSATARPDVYFQTTLAVQSDIEISGSTSGQLALLPGGCGASVLGCHSSSTSRWYYNVPAGPLVVVGERAGPSTACDGGSQQFSAVVRAAPSVPPALNDLCANAEPMELDVVGDAVVLAGTTRGANNDISSVRCSGTTTSFPGHDVFYAVAIGERGILSYAPASSFTNERTYVLGGCGETAAYVCGTSSFNSGFPLSPGTYIIAVDSQRTLNEDAGGAFSGVLSLGAP